MKFKDVPSYTTYYETDINGYMKSSEAKKEPCANNEDEYTKPDYFTLTKCKTDGMIKPKLIGFTLTDGGELVGGEWFEVGDVEQAKKQAAISSAYNFRYLNMIFARENIVILQESVDVGLATEKEENDLFEWKKYRVLLARIDYNKGSDIIWPSMPETSYLDYPVISG